MQKYTKDAMRAIRTGYSEKRYDLKNKLQIQSNTVTNTNDSFSSKVDQTLPFKVYGKNKAA